MDTVLQVASTLNTVSLVSIDCYFLTETCDGDGRVRLVGGPNEFEGRVEVCLEGVWARWCQRGALVVRDETRVVCRQLGHDDGGKFP